MQDVREYLNKRQVRLDMVGRKATIKFWTTCNGNEVPFEIEYDGTPKGFVEELSKICDGYGVEKNIPHGKQKEQEEIKETLTWLSRGLKMLIA